MRTVSIPPLKFGAFPFRSGAVSDVYGPRRDEVKETVKRHSATTQSSTITRCWRKISMRCDASRTLARAHALCALALQAKDVYLEKKR